MNKINTITAVLLSLRTLGDDVFSIHTITTNIREELANGTYELVGGPIIFHEEVKDAFLELMGNVYAAEYMTRHAAGGYREFQRSSAQGLNTPVVPAIPAIPAAPQTTGLSATLTQMILAYLANGPKTTKQIQSRFKSQPLTCEQIKKFLEVCNMVDPATASNPVSRVASR